MEAPQEKETRAHHWRGRLCSKSRGRENYQESTICRYRVWATDLHRLPKMYDDAVKTNLPSIDTSFPKIEKFSNLPDAIDVNPSAFVSIMEGCSKFCSFCVVPHTRGLEVSRPPEQIINEIKKLADRGVREINLLGQNVNAYRAKDFHGIKLCLADLLHLVADIDGVDRIRFTTSHHFNLLMI